MVLAVHLLAGTCFPAATDRLEVRVDRLTYHKRERPWVSAFVTVTDRAGRPVRDLDGRHFRLWEDGRPFKGRPVVEAFVRTDRMLAYALLVDHGEETSTSLTLVRQGVEAFIDRLGFRYPGAVVSYADYARVIAGPTGDPASLVLAVLALEPVVGRPRIYDGLLLGLQTLNAMEPDKAPTLDRWVLVLLTDGRDQGSLFAAEAAESGLIEAETALFVIGYGDESQPNLERLAGLARRSGGGYCFAGNPDDIRPCLLAAAERLLNQYVVSFPADHLKADGQTHRLRVRVTDSDQSGRDDFEFISPFWNTPWPEVPSEAWAAVLLVVLLLLYRRTRSFRYQGHWR